MHEPVSFLQSMGVDLTAHQLIHLGGALFLGLFALSAIFRARVAGGMLPAVWGSLAMGLLASGIFVASRGFADQVPQEAAPYTAVEKLIRGVIILVLVVWSMVLLSAHWLRGSLAKWLHRAAGVATFGTAVWFSATWFGEIVPEQAKEWTAKTIIVQGGILVGLILLAIAFWTREPYGEPHTIWWNRAVSPLILAFTYGLFLRWFSGLLPEEVVSISNRGTIAIVGLILSGTCALIAFGTYSFLPKEAKASDKLAKSKASKKESEKPPVVPTPPVSPPSPQGLPVAIRLPDNPHQGIK